MKVNAIAPSGISVIIPDDCPVGVRTMISNLHDFAGHSPDVMENMIGKPHMISNGAATNLLHHGFEIAPPAEGRNEAMEMPTATALSLVNIALHAISDVTLFARWRRVKTDESGAEPSAEQAEENMIEEIRFDGFVIGRLVEGYTPDQNEINEAPCYFTAH